MSVADARVAASRPRLRCVLPGMRRQGLRGYVPAAGAVLSWWLCVVSGMMAGCDRCAARDPRDALIAAQAERIEAPEALVADLREQLAAALRAGSRNSGNSSMPPSSDDLPGRKPPRRQRRAAERAGKKRRGKQPGSPGASMTWEVPDRAEDHFPEGSCSCGRDLADAADLGVARSFQQEEIPAAPAERVQHDLHEARCACGRAHLAARPAGVPDSALSIGPRLRALTVYLVVFQHVPVERCQQLIADAVPEGFIHSCLAKAASLAADVVRLIRYLIAAAPVAGFDETTLRSGPAGEKKYVHGAFTEQYSAFWLGARSLDSMQDAGILPDFAGIVVSDRYQNYFHSRWKHVTVNQACLSHLLRDYQDCAESYPGAVWPGQAQRALRGLIHAWHTAREQGLPAIPAEVLKPLEHEVRHAVLAGLASVSRVPGPKNSTSQKPGRELLEFCKDRQDDVLRFTTDTRIWPANNISERGVRPLKTQQKVSGRLASDDATQDRLDIRGYIDTARKHGKNAMDVLHDLMLGRPWRPPAQAFSP
jgi:transposase